MKNPKQLIHLITTNSIKELTEKQDITFSELDKLSLSKNHYEQFFKKVNKTKKIINNPKTLECFIRSYLRIFQNNIDKDGRGSSIVIEITKRCNKNCQHCYSKFSGKNIDMPDDVLENLIRFSRTHYKHIFFTGGEPTLDLRVLLIAEKNPDIIFFMFTNGSTMNESYAKKISALGNIIPMLGIDGSSEITHDCFRGKGSYQEAMNAIKLLNKHNVSWGCISLVTEQNAKDVLDQKFVDDKIKKGAFILRYLEYLPVGPQPKTELVLSGETYYYLEKRKNEIVQSGQIYMQRIGQKKCKGLLFFSVDGYIKNCFCFHYAKYNTNNCDIKRSIENAQKDWTSCKWEGECPIYSNPHGLKNHLEKLGWKHRSSITEPYLTDPKIAAHLMHSYKTFLKIVAEKGL